MGPDLWDWPINPISSQHNDRVALIREVPLRKREPAPGKPGMGQAATWREDKALSLNLSPGGILLLMKDPLEPEQVLTMDLASVIPQVRSPTLAEVRWVRRVPFALRQPLHFVGLKFLL